MHRDNHFLRPLRQAQLHGMTTEMLLTSGEIQALLRKDSYSVVSPPKTQYIVSHSYWFVYLLCSRRKGSSYWEATFIKQCNNEQDGDPSKCSFPRVLKYQANVPVGTEFLIK